MPRLIDPRLNRHKGSLLILVVVIIVLVTVAGVIYVQVARSDRAATSRMHQNNIDQVIQSTVAYMQRVLLENLVDEDGNFLNTANGKSGYDYPWTNTDNPGQGDNMFLATTLPDFSAGTPRWRHLSNLMGERINPADGNRAPFIAENSNVALTNAILNADADGNGVRDSTFQPAPVFQIGDVQYIIAPRIVDLSSLVNLNVATRLPTAAADARWIRGYHPTDVNLAFLFGLAQSGGMAELDALLSSRGVTNWQSHGLESTQPPAPGSLSPATRAGHWVNEARIWDHRRQRFDIYEEAALRYRGGLNDSRTTGILETILPGVIRSDSGATRVSQLVGGDAPAQLASYYRGGTSASFSDRTFPTLRHLLTTLSGHSAIATKWGGADFPEPPAPGRLPRYDLTRQHTSPGEAVQRIEELYKRFFAAMTAGAAPFYLNFSAAEVETASLEAALAVHAYSSTSSAVPPRLVAGTTYYGLKPLPFIRQVYLQWAYEDRKTEPEDEDPYTHWMRLDNSVAMAIELGNPFDERIDLANADRPVQIRVVFQGNPVSAVEVSSGTFEADGQFLPPRPAVGEPNSPVIVYSNGQQSLTGTDGRGANIVTDLNLGGQGRVRLPSGSLTIPLSSPAFPNSGPLPLQDVVIELRTRASAAAPWVTYDRFHLRSTSAPGTPVITDNADNDPVPDAISHAEWPEASHRHAQVSFARSGSNWRYLSNRGRDVTMARQPPPAGDEGFSTDASLVVDEKSRQGGGAIQGDTELDSRPINIAGRPIYSLGELGWIFMVGFTSQDTGDLPQRLSGVDGTGGFLSTPEGRRRLFLDVSSNAALTEIPGVGRVPHAAIIMDLFTTLHPGFDGVDNDGDGAVDGMVADANTNEPLPREQLIRGTINVNTAPPEVLAMVLPLPEGFATTQALIDQIVQYRENPGQRQAITGFGQTVRADRPGIASIGELLFINPAASGNPANMQRYGRGLALPPNVPMNLYPMDENADKTAYDGTGDTPEERMARFQMISQVLSTRTDFFAAWVQVRGYRAGRWDEGPVESARFLAIFDRSEVRNPDDTVRVLGVFRID